MAAIAGRRVVAVAGHSAVMFVRVPPGMAGQTGEYREVARIWMAGRTVVSGMPPRCDGEPGVIKTSLIPGRIGGPVARFASCRKAGGDVIRVARLLIVCPMTAVAFPRSPGIDAVFMAGRAIQGGVDALKGINGSVVEARLVPGRIGRPVAYFTCRRKTGRPMVWVLRLLIVRPVTAIAFAGSPCIYAVLMAGTAVQGGVDTLSGKNAVVVERCLLPARLRRKMAELASRREGRLPVVGLRGFLVILAVAGIAVEADPPEVPIFVAAVTAQIPVGAVERHARLGGMVPAHGRPGDRPVAVFAVGPQRGSINVILAPDPVAVIAAHRSPFINPVDMTRGAGDLEMPAFEREGPGFMKTAGYRGPAGRGMTGLAFLRHCPLVGFGVAEAAVPLIGHVRTDLVTGGAILGQAGVLPFEGKARLRGVIEFRRVERPDVGLDSLMLLVAGFAIPGDLAMNSFFRGHPVGNVLMAGQAAGGLDPLPGRMAFRAIQLAFERAVRPGKRTGGSELRLGLLAGRPDQGEHEKAAEAGGEGQQGSGRRSGAMKGDFEKPAIHPLVFLGLPGRPGQSL